MNDTDHNPFDRPAILPPRRPQRSGLWIVACVSVALAVGLAIFVWILSRDVAIAPPPPQAVQQRPNEVTAKVEPPPAAKAPAPVDLVDDDGRTMWASPTEGKPIEWKYLPPGVQLLLAMRPAALAAHSEGEKVLAALGPLGSEGIHSIEQQTGVKFAEIERLVIGWQIVGDQGKLAATLVVYAPNAPSTDSFESGLPDAKRREHGRQNYLQAGERAYYRPSRDGGPTLVVAPAEAISEIIDLAGEAPPLRRDVARVLAQTDAQRLATLIVAPAALFGEGREMFTGQLVRLRRPLFWLLGDELTAAALSLHWDDNFFAEAIATSTLDVPIIRAAQQLADRVAQMPDRIEAYTVELSTTPYSRRVVARLPGMVRKLSSYTRSGFGRDYILLRSYLPAIAGHNLLMGAESALAEPGGEPASAGGRTAPTPTTSPSEQLKRPVSLRIPRDTLEAVLAQLTKDLGVEIIIRGPDLQLDGITKNQSLAIDLSNRPGEEILIQILRAANPDKSAADARDLRQKLVYVIGPKSPGGPEAIFITTRAKAAERGETLPAAFAAEPGK